MSARINETLAFLSGGRVTAPPDQRDYYPGVTMGGEPHGEVDWHKVAMQQTLSGTNSISRTQRGSWQPQEEPTEVESKIAWDERSLHSKGLTY